MVRKSLCLFFCLTLFSCGDKVTFTLDCLSTNLQTGVIAFYPFNGGSINDASSNGNDLINTTSAFSSTDRNGNADCAFQFDNTQSISAHLTTSNSAFLDGLNNLTVSLWYQPLNNTITGSNSEGLFSRGTPIQCPNRMGEWSLALYDCRQPVFGHNNSVWGLSKTNFNNGCQGEATAWVDTWHHMVAVKDDNTYKIFIDGVLNESTTGNAICNDFQPVQDIGDVFIGYDFTGKIDDIVVYNRALSNTEVDELYQLDACCQ